MDSIQFKERMSYFTGTQKYYQHLYFNKELFLTDGCEFIRREGEARWLFDFIAEFRNECEEFQAWELKRMKNGKWKIKATDGNSTILLSKTIPFSTFPIDSIEIWVCDNVCMLPSEY